MWSNRVKKPKITPTQNPEHCIHVRSLENIWFLTIKYILTPSKIEPLTIMFVMDQPIIVKMSIIAKMFFYNCLEIQIALR
jgi:hypothetical protein